MGEVQDRNVKRKEKKPKRPFYSAGPGWKYSVDGHDKFMEQFIKQQCNVLLQSHTYDPGCILDKKI